MALGHRVLVPLDGSTFAERALPFAETIAAHADGELHLVSVHAPQVLAELLPKSYARWPELDRAVRGSLQTYLERVSSDLAAGGRPVRAKVLDGVPDRALLEYSSQERCDLIVMTTHGRGGVDRFWLGSVADRVTRHATVPVMMVPAATSMPSAPVPGDRGPPIRTVIIPLDGSELSEQVLQPAAALGEAFGAEYVLFRAVAPAAYLAIAAEVERPGVPMAELQEWERIEARRALDEVAAHMHAAGLSTTVIVEEEVDAPRALLRLADATPGGMIAMATHGRGGLRRAVLGSVTDKVVRATARPVLIVRPGENAPQRPENQERSAIAARA
jgi:nucleotide-binding universal stress UspA family protein